MQLLEEINENDDYMSKNKVNENKRKSKRKEKQEESVEIDNESNDEENSDDDDLNFEKNLYSQEILCKDSSDKLEENIKNGKFLNWINFYISS